MFTTELQYVLVRYMLNELGDEAANVGVVAVVNDPPRIFTRFLADPTIKSRSDARVRRDSVLRFAELINSSVDVSTGEHSDRPLQDRVLPRLREIGGNVVRLSLPRSVLTNDVEKEVDTLFAQLVAPKSPASAGERKPRDPIGGLRLAATRTVVREVRNSVLRDYRKQFRRHHAVKGKTHTTTFDAALLGRRGAHDVEHLFHHVLLLPDAEESFNQAASLLWKWNDVQARNGKDRDLTAILYSKEGAKREGAKEAKATLEKEKVRVADVRQVSEIVRAVQPQLSLAT